MKNQADRGIHAGGHGAVIDVVSDFHVEVFEEMTEVGSQVGFYACEI